MLNCYAVADHKYCFIAVVVRWPDSAHNVRIFSNSFLNRKFHDGSIPNCEKIFVEGKPVYPLLPFLMKELTIGRRNEEEQYYHPQEWLYFVPSVVSNQNLGVLLEIWSSV